MKNTELQAILDHHSPEAIIDALEPFVTPRRKGRIEHVLKGRLNGIQLAIEAPSDINNALAAVRTCEAMGVSNIHLITPEGDAGAIRAVTQGAFYWVNIHTYPSFEAFSASLRQTPSQLAGAKMEAPLQLQDIPINNPLCLMMGNEQRGLSKQAQEDCDMLYSIPMVGMSESLNLSVSAAISLYDTTQRKRLALGRQSDLSETERSQMQAKYYLRSVSPRLIKALLS